MEEFSKEEIYKLITRSVDIDNKLVMDLWKDYCRDYRDVEELQFPYSPGPDLYDLKAIIKCWISIFSFPEKWDCLFRRKPGGRAQEHRRRDQPHLKTECQLYTKMHHLPEENSSWDYPFSICERCFERGESASKEKITIKGENHGKENYSG